MNENDRRLANALIRNMLDVEESISELNKKASRFENTVLAISIIGVLIIIAVLWSAR